MKRKTVAQLDREVGDLRQQVAMLVEAAILLDQGRFTGEMPNAEAFLKAIKPADTGWSGVPFRSAP